MIDAVDTPELYDLQFDWNESRDVSEQRGAVVERLMGLVEQVRERLGDYDRIGADVRFFDPGPRRPKMDSWKN